MKIAQFYDNDQIRLGLIHDQGLIPLNFDGDTIDFICARAPIKPVKSSPIPVKDVKFAPPISRPSKIIALGLNYRDHAEETKGKIPDQPLIFSKFPNSLIGCYDHITWNSNLTKKVDFEAELAVIIGKTARNFSEKMAMDAVFGYTCANDVSARDLQFGDGQWVRGKSLDTFCPIGPWIVNPEEIPDPHSLKIRCVLNGELMQDSSTSRMIFKLPFIISFLSRHFTLFPGDIILTGTPHGVGAFREPSVYLEDGDEVVVEIELIGRLINTCRIQ